MSFGQPIRTRDLYFSRLGIRQKVTVFAANGAADRNILIPMDQMLIALWIRCLLQGFRTISVWATLN